MTEDGRAADRGRDRRTESAQARQRVLEASYELFSRHGINAVGIDRIVAEAKVAKMTLYRHFSSKEQLVLAFLQMRERRWTYEWLAGEIERRTQEPAERLLATFDALGDWFARRDFEGCSFLRTLLEAGSGGAVHDAAVAHLATVRELLAAYAREAGASEPDALARDLELLMLGAMASASSGDRAAARRARPIAQTLVSRAVASSP